MNSAVFTSDEFIGKIKSYLKDTLSEGRYEHSVSTANTCRKLAEMFYLDCPKAYFTGLVHDIAREYPAEKLIELATEDGKPVDHLHLTAPVLLHGRAGATVLEKKFGIYDQEVLDAIRVHTTGDSGMSSLGKILFVADYIEPGRKHITQEFLAKLQGQSLDRMVFLVLRGTLDHLASTGKRVAPDALRLLKEFELAE